MTNGFLLGLSQRSSELIPLGMLHTCTTFHPHRWNYVCRTIFYCPHARPIKYVRFHQSRCCLVSHSGLKSKENCIKSVAAWELSLCTLILTLFLCYSGDEHVRWAGHGLCAKEGEEAANWTETVSLWNEGLFQLVLWMVHLPTVIIVSLQKPYATSSEILQPCLNLLCWTHWNHISLDTSVHNINYIKYLMYHNENSHSEYINWVYKDHTAVICSFLFHCYYGKYFCGGSNKWIIIIFRAETIDYLNWCNSVQFSVIYRAPNQHSCLKPLYIIRLEIVQ